MTDGLVKRKRGGPRKGEERGSSLLPQLRDHLSALLDDGLILSPPEYPVPGSLGEWRCILCPVEANPHGFNSPWEAVLHTFLAHPELERLLDGTAYSEGVGRVRRELPHHESPYMGRVLKTYWVSREPHKSQWIAQVESRRSYPAGLTGLGKTERVWSRVVLSKLTENRANRANRAEMLSERTAGAGAGRYRLLGSPTWTDLEPVRRHKAEGHLGDCSEDPESPLSLPALPTDLGAMGANALLSSPRVPQWLSPQEEWELGISLGVLCDALEEDRELTARNLEDTYEGPVTLSYLVGERFRGELHTMLLDEIELTGKQRPGVGIGVKQEEVRDWVLRTCNWNRDRRNR